MRWRERERGERVWSRQSRMSEREPGFKKGFAISSKALALSGRVTFRFFRRERNRALWCELTLGLLASGAVAPFLSLSRPFLSGYTSVCLSDKSGFGGHLLQQSSQRAASANGVRARVRFSVCVCRALACLTSMTFEQKGSFSLSPCLHSAAYCMTLWLILVALRGVCSAKNDAYRTLYSIEPRLGLTLLALACVLCQSNVMTFLSYEV